jgi:hypothetical protein
MDKPRDSTRERDEESPSDERGELTGNCLSITCYHTWITAAQRRIVRLLRTRFVGENGLLVSDFLWMETSLFKVLWLNSRNPFRHDFLFMYWLHSRAFIPGCLELLHTTDLPDDMHTLSLILDTKPSGSGTKIFVQQYPKILSWSDRLSHLFCILPGPKARVPFDFSIEICSPGSFISADKMSWKSLVKPRRENNFTR